MMIMKVVGTAAALIGVGLIGAGYRVLGIVLGIVGLYIIRKEMNKT